MSSARYVPTEAAKNAAKGREAEIIRALGIAWNGSGKPINCPDPAHPDRHPSWRLMDDGRAVCTCRQPHDVFDIIGYVRGLDFEASKIMVAEILGRPDLIVEPGDGLTLAAYAEAKRLPVEFLLKLGLHDARLGQTPVVAIPFHDVDGNISGTHFRLALAGEKDKRFRWRKGSKMCAYGAHRAGTLAAAGYAVIVEGESDAQTLWHHGFPALGLPGAALWKEERDAPLLAEVPIIYVVVEPDLGGMQTLNWLAKSSIATRARLLHLPPETKDPSALYLADPEAFPGAFQTALDAAEPFSSSAQTEETTAPKTSSVGVSLDDFYAYMPMHSYIYTPTRALWPASSINARIPPIRVGPDAEIKANTWLDQNRPVEQMTWAPGLPEIIRDRLLHDGGWLDRSGVQCFNQYLPPTVVLGNASGADQWIKHVHLVYPNEPEHIISWLAHRVQRPQEKINHGLVLGGSHGIGKDTLIEPARQAIGPWNFQEASPAQMLGRFNGFLKAVILRVSEARDLGEFNRFAFYDHMKAYMASPPDTLRIDEKHLREYSILNVCGVIITTNHKTDGIYLPAEDRRHYVAWSDLVKEQFANGYWPSIYSYYENGGTEAVAAYLKQLDISEFDPKAPPPKTAAFWAIVDASRPGEEGELADVLDAMQRPAAFTLRALQDQADGGFAEWLADRKNRRVIPHRLEKCGYEPVRNPDAGDGLWVIQKKRQAVYAKASKTLPDRIGFARAMSQRTDNTGTEADPQDQSNR